MYVFVNMSRRLATAGTRRRCCPHVLMGAQLLYDWTALSSQ